MNPPPVIVFLDFDGVLNTPDFRRRFLQQEGNAIPIDPTKVALLNILEESLRPLWVISSAWRSVYSVGDLNRILRAAGFRGKIFDKMGIDVRAPSKGEEIYSYLGRYPISDGTRVVILDDLPEANVEGAIFCLVDGNTGLTLSQVESLILKVKR